MSLHLPEIPPINKITAGKAIIRHNELTKPLGSLGRLEDLSIQIAGMTDREHPQIHQKAVFVFAADHGVAGEGVSAYPVEVTAQMVANIIKGKAAVSVLAKHGNVKVIVVDVIGELFKIYSLGTIVYCGGSLVPKGGQNILEAAAWGKVIFYGPSMEDFGQEAALLEDAGAGIRIRNARELSEGMLQILADPQDARQRGERGRAVVLANMGAAQRYAEMMIRHLA